MSARWRMPLGLVCLVCLVCLGLPLVSLSCAGQAPRAAAVCKAAECERLAPRHVVALNGEWQFQKTKSDAASAPAGAFQSMKVPGVVYSEAAGQSEYLWLRRELELPESMRGQRVFLRLGGARFHPHVFVDGKLVAERMDGWTPFEVELTPQLEPGKRHRLEVRCQDWGATFADGYHLPNPLPGEARSVPKGKVLAPVGGHLGFYGAWDDVELEGRGSAFATDVAIVPSNLGSLRVRGHVDGPPGAYRVSAVVLDGERELQELPAVSAKSGEAFELASAFDTAERWSPEHPKLYALRLFVRRESDSALLDLSEQSFGFKDVWTEGPDVYVNGVKRHLLASSTWPSAQPQSREEVRQALSKIKEGHNVAFRLHTQPWQRLWLEEADKLGLFIIEEGALWCDGAGAYAYTDPRFWTNAKEHLAGMVRRDRNHASVIMWSLENELLHCGAERFDKDVEKKLADLGRFVKALDPEHLITFEADHDPGGSADMVGLHYPHEVPAFSDYPNTADWLSSSARTGTEGGLMGSRDKQFVWDRKKPLYIGEYLWCPDQDYAVGSVFFGPEAYRDRERYHREAQALAWKDQTLAYRRAGVAGICPWTAFDHGGKVAPVLFEAASEVQVPVAVYLRQKDTRFFAGEKLARTLEVYNDVPVAQDLVLAWQLEGDSKQGRQELSLDPAEYRAVTVELSLPVLTKARELAFSYELSKGGQTLHGGKAMLRVEPKAKLVAPPGGMRIAVWDPAGAWSKQVLGAGLAHRRVSAPGEIAAKDAARTLLVVAPAALDVGALSGVKEALPVIGPSSGALARFMLAGGRAIVLEQSQPSETLGLELVAHPSTLAFALDPAHPLLAGLDAGAFKFWRGDHYLSRYEIRRPQRAGARALVVSGGAAELDQGPVVELSYGAGRALWLQALVGAKFDSEPAARRLLQNALDYLARPPALAAATVISDEPELVPALGALGVDYQEATEVPAAAPLLVLGAGGAKVQAALGGLKTALARGRAPKTIYWHAPSREAFEAARSELGASELTVVPGSGPLSVTGAASGPFAAVCAEDLLWKGTPRGESWTRGFEPDLGVAAKVLAPAGAATGRFDKLALGDPRGTYVSQTKDGIVFATVGTASAPLDIAQAGLRYLRLTASGTTVAGVLPVAKLSIAGGPSATIQLTKKERSEYFALLDIPSGKRTLTVEFVNDAASGGEDRNLTVHELSLSSEPWSGGGAKLLTLPAAVVELTPPGGKTRVLVDFVRWPGESKNALRAGRYASALFAALGARFRAPDVAPSWLPTAAFRLNGPSPYSEVSSKEITLRSAGTAVQAFTVSAQGTYVPVLRARSDPAKNVYAIVELAVDGKPAGSVEIKSSQTKLFELPPLALGPGRHEVALSFTNDLYENGADRNLFVEAVGFRQ